MTEKWVKDTGLVGALVFLVLGYFDRPLFLVLSGLFIASLMFAPIMLRPLAYLWLQVTRVVGYIGNTVFFSAVFFAVVTPMGLLRRMLGGDPLMLRRHSSRTSMFVERVHTYGREDVLYPY